VTDPPGPPYLPYLPYPPYPPYPPANVLQSALGTASETDRRPRLIVLPFHFPATEETCVRLADRNGDLS
jgi:hypothetical protein